MENKSLVNQILHNQKVTEYGYDGYGIVRINNNYPILVENALKDEIVDVQVIQQNAKFALGKVVTQHVKSEKRIDVANKELVYSYNAPLIIISYEDQLKFKTQVIKSMFAREFNFYDVADCKESKKQFHYRNKLTLHVQQDEKEIKIGFFVRNTHIILEQKNYDLVNEELDKIVKIVVAFLKANATQIRNWKLYSIVFKYSDKTNETLVIFDSYNKLKTENEIAQIIKQAIGNEKANLIFHVINHKTGKVVEQKIYGQEKITFKIGKYKYLVNYDSFFQVNDDQAKAIFDFILKKNEFKGNELVIDAYAGVGTIGLYIAKNVKHVVSVENIHNATENAKLNAKLNKISNFKALTMNSTRYFDTFVDKENVGIVIFDPPRAGLNTIIIRKVIEKKIDRIIYLSCNPHTLVRDLKAFLNGDYHIKLVQPFDMFPQTQHIETLCILERNKDQK